MTFPLNAFLPFPPNPVPSFGGDQVTPAAAALEATIASNY